ncbi:MAG TPA: GIY-YIG nuclease family protein [Bauldia sp.]|nr:GIY-YIG nuclease family protein [Bauldia sp.]
MPAFCYILQCADGSYYVGSTKDDSIDRRLGEHQAGVHDGYTAARRPVTLVWAQQFDRIDDAFFLERQLKGWSRRKKEALIRGEWDLLPLLSRRRGGRPRGG